MKIEIWVKYLYTIIFVIQLKHAISSCIFMAFMAKMYSSLVMLTEILYDTDTEFDDVR